MKITNGRTLLEFDPQTGSIVSLRDTLTGLVHLDARGEGRDDGRLFRIMLPHPDRFSRHIESTGQAAPTLRERGAAIELDWPALVTANGEPSGVSAHVTVEPGDEDEIRLTLTVRNGGPDEALDVWFPMLGGWTGIGGKGKDVMILGAFSKWDPFSLPVNAGTTYARVQQRHSIQYPVTMYAPWFDLSGKGGGLSYILYNTTPRNGYVALENQAGYDSGPLRLLMGWAAQCVIEPGRTWTSPTVGISVHGADWHATADRYGKWMDTWWQAPPTAHKHRAMIGYQNVFLRGFDGEPFHDLSAVPEIARAGLKYGVDHLSVWDFVTLGNYCKRADLDLLDYPAADRETLREGLLQAKAEGVNVSALINFRLTDPSSTLYKNETHDQVLRQYTGTPRTEMYPATHYFPGSIWASGHVGSAVHVCSPHSPGYRARVLRQTREYLDLGYTSMFFDQPFESPDYGHRAIGGDPELTHAAIESLTAEVRNILRAADPDAYMIGEFCDAFVSQHIDLWMSWYPEVDQAIRAAFCFPRTMTSWVVDNDAGQASQAFAVGTYLCLCNRGSEATLDAVPEFAQHVAALAKLRRETAARTVYGRFRDDRGLEVAADGGGVAYAFDSPSGPAVIVAAPTGAAKVRVKVDPAAFDRPSGAEEGRIVSLDGSVRGFAGCSQEFELEANDVAVWEL